MLESALCQLLDDAVNTSTKLAIVLLFAERPDLCLTPCAVRQRVCRDIWSVEQALQELETAGILVSTNGHYGYTPAPLWQPALVQLLAAYDEPLLRQELTRVMSELDSYAPYRDALAHPCVIVSST